MKKISVILAFALLISISTGCFTEEEPKPKKYYVTFTVDGTQKKYKTTEDDGFWTSTSGPSPKYITSWFEGSDGSGDSVYMTLPTSVASSSAYDETSDSSTFSFGIDYEGTWYFVEATSTFDLVVTEWGSVGDPVRGTFTGTVTDGTTVKTLTNGIFETTNSTDEVD